MELDNPKYSKQEVSQKFNLKTLLGYEPSESQKELFYNLVVDRIVERTTSGDDVNGAKFMPYSPEYAKKKGVPRSSVDMVLNGDMLASFQESKQGKNVLKIKIESGVETLKAFNHCTGDTLPKREFFGIKSESEIKTIIKKVNKSASDSKTEKKENLANLRDAINNLITTEVKK